MDHKPPEPEHLGLVPMNEEIQKIKARLDAIENMLLGDGIRFDIPNHCDAGKEEPC